MESDLRTLRTSRLRDRRVSIAGARYFLTICVKNGEELLLRGSCSDTILSQLEHQSKGKDWRLLCGVLMPDHFHLIFRLGNRLTLSQVVAKFKSGTKSIVRWQDNYFEHRLRPDESEEEYAFYVFMNPYRAELVSYNSHWSWWRRWRHIPYEFEEKVASGESIPEEWLDIESKITLELRTKA